MKIVEVLFQVRLLDTISQSKVNLVYAVFMAHVTAWHANRQPWRLSAHSQRWRTWRITDLVRPEHDDCLSQKVWNLKLTRELWDQSSDSGLWYVRSDCELWDLRPACEIRVLTPDSDIWDRRSETWLQDLISDFEIWDVICEIWLMRYEIGDLISNYPSSLHRTPWNGLKPV